LSFDGSQLIRKDFRPISGWTILLFAAVLTVGSVGIALFLRYQPHGLITILTLFYFVALASVAIAVASKGREAAPALGIRPARWRYVLLGPLATLVLSVLVSQIGPQPEGMKQVIELAQDPRKLLPSLIAFALMAPLVEELVFRGLLYGWIESRCNSTAALIVSSLAFAAAHFEPAHIVLVLPLGFLFGWLRQRTNSLVPSLVAHVVNNGFAVLVVAFFGG
jgi:membrane protease YdiL (CAAX protease family)